MMTILNRKNIGLGRLCPIITLTYNPQDKFKSEELDDFAN